MLYYFWYIYFFSNPAQLTPKRAVKQHDCALNYSNDECAVKNGESKGEAKRKRMREKWWEGSQVAQKAKSTSQQPSHKSHYFGEVLIVIIIIVIRVVNTKTAACTRCCCRHRQSAARMAPLVTKIYMCFPFEREKKTFANCQ
jgi:hypothetical protein